MPRKNRLSYEYEPEVDPVDFCVSEYEMMRYFNCTMSPQECSCMIDRMVQHYQSIYDNKDPFAMTASEHSRENINRTLMTLKRQLDYLCKRRSNRLEYLMSLNQLIHSYMDNGNDIPVYILKQHESNKNEIENLYNAIETINRKIDVLTRRLSVI